MYKSYTLYNVILNGIRNKMQSIPQHQTMLAIVKEMKLEIASQHHHRHFDAQCVCVPNDEHMEIYRNETGCCKGGGTMRQIQKS